MESLKQDLFTGFAFGTVSAELTIESKGAKKRPEMLANIFSYVSKGVYKTLVPRLTAVIQNNNPPAGDQVVTEQIKIELLGQKVTLDLKVQLNVELGSPDKEALRYTVVHWIGTEVAEDVVGRISKRLQGETINEYYEQHPEEASPFGGGLGAMLGQALGGGIGGIEVMDVGSSAGGGPTLH